MAHTVPLTTGIATKHIGLGVWMDRVLETSDEAQRNWSPDAVHDLRVAIRRCRTIADALSEVNPAPGWRKIKKSTRRLFHTLGVLRDTQVERDWVKKLGAPGDPVRRHLLRILTHQEKKHRAAAARALDRFDRKDWRKWSRKLPSKAEFFPLESVVFQRLALESLNVAVDLYHKARKGRSRIAWHRLRIGIKRFRYLVENFLPKRYQAWGDDLKRMQDLLGEVHDLDVLRIEVRRRCAEFDPAATAAWLEKIEAERKSRLDEFRSMTNDKEFLWLSWRGSLQGGNSLHPITLVDAQSASSAG
jgi:CHAD domain-containing protein